MKTLTKWTKEDRIAVAIAITWFGLITTIAILYGH